MKSACTIDSFAIFTKIGFANYIVAVTRIRVNFFVITVYCCRSAFAVKVGRCTFASLFVIFIGTFMITGGADGGHISFVIIRRWNLVIFIVIYIAGDSPPLFEIFYVFAICVHSSYHSDIAPSVILSYTYWRHNWWFCRRAVSIKITLFNYAAKQVIFCRFDAPSFIFVDRTIIDTKERSFYTVPSVVILIFYYRPSIAVYHKIVIASVASLLHHLSTTVIGMLSAVYAICIYRWSIICKVGYLNDIVILIIFLALNESPACQFSIST